MKECLLWTRTFAPFQEALRQSVNTDLDNPCGAQINPLLQRFHSLLYPSSSHMCFFCFWCRENLVCRMLHGGWPSGTTVYCDHLPNTWRLVSKFKRECLNQRRWVCSCVVMWARVNSLIRLWLGNFASIKLTSHHVTNNITWFVRCSKDETKAAFSGHKTIKKYQRILVYFNDTQSSLIFC